MALSLGPLSVNLGDLSSLPLVLAYAFCSSMLAIINKCAITVFPFPAVLTALQYAVSVVAVWVLGRAGALEHDPLTLPNVRAFLPAAAVFYVAIFTNTTLLKYANVDTFIMFRSSTPLLVALADTLFRAQPWPHPWTFASLGIILAGAVGYVITDSTFSVRAYSWAFAYLFTITFEMVYIKHIVTHLGLNTWGFVYYNNVLSFLMSPISWFLTGEYIETAAIDVQDYLTFWTILAVGLSCIFGLAISFFGFACRKAISATSFTVVGVTNKLLTVIINILIWDKHATPLGIVALLVTITGGVLYQQACVHFPPKAPPEPEDEADEEEAKPLKSTEVATIESVEVEEPVKPPAPQPKPSAAATESKPPAAATDGANA
eukprot:SM000022S07179  [mRNA]  locus=s22:366735:367984:- [translate_table: standard]